MSTTKLNQNQYTPINTLSYQCIINAGFTVNQRTYVSNATLAAGVYGHDRWKAGASGGDYTFTQLAQSTTITIKTGKSLIQVIEDKNVIGGTYTLSWTGTAQARFGIDSATPSGSYSVSPITITGQTAGTVMSVEFNEGTLGQVNCANSSVALPFMPKSVAQEELDCKRYCRVLKSGNWFRQLVYTASQTYYCIPMNTMRIKPIILLGTEVTDWQVHTINGTAQTGFVLNTTYGSNDGITLEMRKTSHGLTDSYLSINTDNKNFLEAEL